MTEIIGVILDNGIQSQNQDYLPSRIILQREIVHEIINKVISPYNESVLGIFPLAQKVKNDILTPTKQKQSLINFLYTCDLERKTDHKLAFFQLYQALRFTDIQTKKVIVFLTSKIDEYGELLIYITNIATKGIEVYVVCYGDALEFGELAKSEIQMSNVKILVIRPKENFEDVVFSMLTTAEYQDEDPELLEVLEKSKYDK